MHKIALFMACVCAAAAQRFGPDENYAPIPYAFNYLSQLVDGSHSHEEQGDGNGRVTGRYTLTDADGRSRTVTYTADENGFRAQVETNEQGTESKNPADVVFQSSALPGPEAAIANEPNRFRGAAAPRGFKS
ncbi:cuticle protein 10.9 [Ixodes scapularis]|nr:cuticle protein 10.9 [Ixodes scapularis]